MDIDINKKLQDQINEILKEVEISLKLKDDASLEIIDELKKILGAVYIKGFKVGVKSTHQFTEAILNDLKQ